MRSSALALLFIVAVGIAATHGEQQAAYQSSIDAYIKSGDSADPDLFPSSTKPASELLKYARLSVDYNKLVADFLTQEDLDTLRARATHTTRNCDSISQTVGVEKFDPSMLVRNRTVRPWPGGVHKAYYQWNTMITKEKFEAMPYWLREPGVCDHCTYVARYKLIHGELYRKCNAATKHCPADYPDFFQVVEEQLLLAAHFYNLRDVDFAVQFGDGASHTWPTIAWNIDARHEDAGFTMPYQNGWWHPRTLRQILLWHKCLMMRFPTYARTPKVAWRGSSTDPYVAPIDFERLLDVKRVRLHLLGMWYPEFLDVQLFMMLQGWPGVDRVAEQVLQVQGKKLSMQLFQNFTGLVDIDGNGWSSRFFFLTQQATPIIKQASPNIAYFEHLFAPGRQIAQIRNDLLDLPAAAKALVQMPHETRSKLVEQMAGLAAVALNKWSMIEATAYALHSYGQLITWLPEVEPGYERVPTSLCCKHGRLPKEVIEAVRSGR